MDILRPWLAEDRAVLLFLLLLLYMEDCMALVCDLVVNSHLDPVTFLIYLSIQ